MDITELERFLLDYKFADYDTLPIDGSPTLNKQNVHKMCVLLSLITEIVAKNSGESDYMLNKKNIEVEHIWANHYERHLTEFEDKESFANTRNNIGDLLVLSKPINGSYNDDTYEEKVKYYVQQNILAQTLHEEKYTKNPGFVKFKNESGLDFKPYKDFTKESIKERANLYKEILKYEFAEYFLNEDDVENNDDNLKSSKRKRRTFKELNIPIGSTLQIKGHEETVKTVDNKNQVDYNGEIMSVSKAAWLILHEKYGRMGINGGFAEFLYMGKKLYKYSTEFNDK